VRPRPTADRPGRDDAKCPNLATWRLVNDRWKGDSRYACGLHKPTVSKLVAALVPGSWVTTERIR
jgi:hypothetical protein